VLKLRRLRFERRGSSEWEGVWVERGFDKTEGFLAVRKEQDFSRLMDVCF
jgi:hypothetical protein